MTKVSSKGQVVIPQNIRDKLKLNEGESLTVSTEGDIIVLKKVQKDLNKDDLETLKSIKEAWKDIDEGRFKKMGSEKFLAEISKW